CAPLRDGPALTIQMGETRQARLLENGTERTRTSWLLDADTIERAFSSGCSNTASNQDFYTPNLTWNNCGQGPWSSGKAEDMRVKGKLWPFKVGNEVHYQWKSTNGAGQTNPRAFRSCEVTDTVMAEAAGKSYPAYRVDCSEHNNRKWVYFYAPGVDETVRIEDHHPKSGLRVIEFVERIQ
ncbi:MAG: hypothetical protein HXY26_03150, partial [Hydrogenophilaceae bacterium]|nr:hypothetical protein [Hydrogenophilaceae bacterium]